MLLRISRRLTIGLLIELFLYGILTQPEREEVTKLDENKTEIVIDIRDALYTPDDVIEPAAGEVSELTDVSNADPNGEDDAHDDRNVDNGEHNTRNPDADPADDSVESAEVSAEAEEPSVATYEATAYVSDCEGCIGITYSGYDVRHTIYTPEGHRVIAADPAVLPVGTRVIITYADGTQEHAQALDIGSAINGHEIDLLVGSVDEALTFGRQAVAIEIINEGER